MDLKTLLTQQWDRTAAVAATALGGLLLLIGWFGTSGAPLLAEQAPYILSGGVGGIFLLGVGATLWISADLRDEWRKLDRIEAALLDGQLRFVDEQAAEPSPEVPAYAPEGEPEVLDAAPRVRRNGSGRPGAPDGGARRTRTALLEPPTEEIPVVRTAGAERRRGRG